MNIASWIAKRISINQNNSIGSFIIKISITALALSLGVMIISNSLINGFQIEIKSKLFDLWGHAQIKNLDNNTSLQDKPISNTDLYSNQLKNEKEISKIEPYIQKAGIIKTKDNIEGIVLKSWRPQGALPSLTRYLSEGSGYETGDTLDQLIWISEHTAGRLQLTLNDKVIVYFIEQAQAPKVRKFYVKGIYNTGLLEYDEVFAFVDYTVLSKLTGYGDTLLSGIQLHFDNYKNMNKIALKIEQNILPQNQICRSMGELNPNLFDWLALQNINESIIMILMIIVSIVNMANMLLILIVERTNMIGLLKALGLKDFVLQKIFLHIAFRVVGWGLFFGNLFGFGLCLIQQKCKIITLPQESYYVKVAPVVFDFNMLILINVGVVFITLLSLIIPTLIIQKISPTKAIQFD